MLQVIFIPEGVYNFITGPSVAKILLIIQIFFSIFSYILIFAIILLIYRMQLAAAVKAKMKAAEKAGETPRESRILGRWNKIKERLDTNDENNYKLAILEADAMFDGVVESLGYLGKDLEDKIRQIPSREVGNADELIEAHKLRNTIVDNPKTSISYYQAKKAFDVFEKALKGMKSL